MKNRNCTDRMLIEYSRTNARTFSFSNRAAPFWNTVKENVKRAQLKYSHRLSMNPLDKERIMTESFHD